MNDCDCFLFCHSSLFVVNYLLGLKLDGVVLAVGMEGLTDYLVRLAVIEDSAALVHDGVPPHADHHHAINIQRTGIHRALAARPVHACPHRPGRLELNACAVESEPSLLCLRSVQDGHTMFQ